MKALLILIVTSFTSLLTINLYAQKVDPDADINIWASPTFTADGISTEWKEPLNNYNTATNLAFALANDQNHLYLIIESPDRATTLRVINAGITLNINTSGKKKDGIKIRFSEMQQPPAPHDQKDTINHPMPNEEHSRHGIKVIQVSGFKTIPDGILSIPNQDGLEVAANFNKQGDYICELSIPLTLLDLKGNGSGAIAYNVKINDNIKGVPHEGGRKPGGDGMGGGRPPGGGGGGHRGGGMGGMGKGGPGGASDQSKSSDFWIKYLLARPTDSFREN